MLGLFLGNDDRICIIDAPEISLPSEFSVHPRTGRGTFVLRGLHAIVIDDQPVTVAVYEVASRSAQAEAQRSTSANDAEQKSSDAGAETGT